MKGESAPHFEPVRAGLYLREYDALIADAEKAVKTIKANAANWIWDLSDGSAEVIIFLRKEGKPNSEARIKEVVSNRANYEKAGLKPKAAASVRAWMERIEEIKRAKNGVISQPQQP